MVMVKRMYHSINTAACITAVIVIKGAAAALAPKLRTNGSDNSSSRTRSMSEQQQQSFLGIYKPGSNVDDIAALDVDLRSIDAGLAKGDADGMAEARAVYANGIDNTSSDTYTLKQLSTKMSKTFWASPTFGHVVDWNGEQDYANQFVEASFGGNDYHNFKSQEYVSNSYSNCHIEPVSMSRAHSPK